MGIITYFVVGNLLLIGACGYLLMSESPLTDFIIDQSWIDEVAGQSIIGVRLIAPVIHILVSVGGMTSVLVYALREFILITVLFIGFGLATLWRD